MDNTLINDLQPENEISFDDLQPVDEIGHQCVSPTTTSVRRELRRSRLGLDDDLATRIQAISSRSLATGTLKNYRTHKERWEAHARQNGFEPYRLDTETPGRITIFMQQSVNNYVINDILN